MKIHISHKYRTLNCLPSLCLIMEPALKAYGGVDLRVPSIPNLGARCRLSGHIRVLWYHRTEGWKGTRTGLDDLKNRRIFWFSPESNLRFVEFPAHSKSSYPDSDRFRFWRNVSDVTEFQPTSWLHCSLHRLTFQQSQLLCQVRVLYLLSHTVQNTGLC